VAITGGPADAACPVATAMGRLARDVGVPESSLRLERTSRTTRENGVYTAPMLRREGAQRLLIVTDRLHMPRAAGVFAELGFDVTMASVPVYEGHLDNVSMLAAGFREMAALVYYRSRGWVAPVSALIQARPDTTSGSTMHAATTREQGPVVLLGASYAKSWTLAAIDGTPLINRGAGGEQSFELLARFERDVVPSEPKAVILWGFINDIFRADDPERARARVRESYVAMVAAARQRGIEPILATEVTIRPPDSLGERVASWVGSLLGKTSYQDAINRQIIELNGWLIDLGRREGLLVLDFHRATSDSAGRRRAEYIQADGSHITPEGYAALTDYALPLLARHFAAGQGRRAGTAQN
jgi:lysophospholipase L1-like esterase